MATPAPSPRASHVATSRASSTSSGVSERRAAGAPVVAQRVRGAAREVVEIQGRPSDADPVDDAPADEPEGVEAPAARVLGQHEPRPRVGGGDRAAERVEQPGQALAAAPEPAGALEALAVGGPAHLGVDVGQQRRPAVALAGEERERLVEPAAVEVRVEVAEAGRQAAAHLAVGRGAVPPRERAPAVAQAEERVELLEQLDRRRAAAQRPDADAQPGCGRRGDLQDGERDVEAAAQVDVAVDVLAADVARRTVAADEAALEQERAELRARRLVVDRLGLGHPAALGGRRRKCARARVRTATDLPT